MLLMDLYAELGRGLGGPAPMYDETCRSPTMGERACSGLSDLCSANEDGDVPATDHRGGRRRWLAQQYAPALLRGVYARLAAMAPRAPCRLRRAHRLPGSG